MTGDWYGVWADGTPTYGLWYADWPGAACACRSTMMTYRPTAARGVYARICARCGTRVTPDVMALRYPAQGCYGLVPCIGVETRDA